MPGFLNALKSDESLMQAYQNGDARAFEIVYARHKDALFNFLYRSVRHLQQVEDLAQDIWMSIIHSIESYEAAASFKTYLYRIARNRLVDHWRRESHRQADSLDENHDVLPPAAHGNPEAHARLGEVLHAIAELPQAQAEALLLAEEGFSRIEIAAITDTNPETVKSRLRYARNALQHLEQDYER